jgi:hypothetical protein
MKVYRGYRKMTPGNRDEPPVTSECVVMVEMPSGGKRPLRPRNDIRNHSPTGFEWGYGGSGPAQLALALVADCCGRKAASNGAIYQRVKAKLIAGLPHDGWMLTEEQIQIAVGEAETEMLHD